MKKPRIFIGSSREVLDRKIVDQLILDLSDDFELKPWNKLFRPMEYTIDQLEIILKQVDAAIFIFANDDKRESRGQNNNIPRDNVVWECGLFIGLLSRNRVLILRENDCAIPSDFLNMTLSTFDSFDENKREVEIRKFSDEVRKRWINLSPFSITKEFINDKDLGVHKTLNEALDYVNRIIDKFSNFIDNSTLIDKPLSFDVSRLCVLAYAEVLDLVKKEYRTTTFLSSGFWTNQDVEIMSANRRMTRRLKDIPGSSLKRLFLVTEPINQELKIYKQNLVYLKDHGHEEKIESLKNKLESNKRNIRELKDNGFEIKVAYQDEKIFKDFIPEELWSKFKYDDTEIAIYDDFRVDFFGGGKLGKIVKLDLHCSAVKDFETYLQKTLNYFNYLWSDENKAPQYQSWDIDNYLNHLDDYRNYVQARINYTSNYLLKYEKDIDKGDRDLKIVEMSFVQTVLRNKCSKNKIKRYLDIGTCTARYPFELIELTDLIDSNIKIIGIDNDSDCVEFVSRRIEEEGKRDKIEVIMLDFCQDEIPENFGKFQLITCMLGTLSHFGWNKLDNWKKVDDTLQSSIKRMAELLDENGILIIGSWSRYSCENRNMLSIYMPEDKNKLAKWTPTLSELQERLKNAGLKIDPIESSRNPLEQKLDILVCQLP